jgi:cell division protein FtsN
MPRDYVKTPRPKHKASLPGWVWMLGGLFIGLFVALLIYLDNTNSKRETANIGKAVTNFFQQKAQDVREATGAGTAETDTKSADNKTLPRFDFYTILPELEVAIPEEELIAASKKPATQNTHNGVEYMLQAGSFRSLEQADRLKAKLALQGIVASIQTVRIKDSETWHRVRVGPISDIATLNQTRKRLSDIGVPSIVIKDKG